MNTSANCGPPSPPMSDHPCSILNHSHMHVKITFTYFPRSLTCQLNSKQRCYMRPNNPVLGNNLQAEDEQKSARCYLDCIIFSSKLFLYCYQFIKNANYYWINLSLKDLTEFKPLHHLNVVISFQENET